MIIHWQWQFAIIGSLASLTYLGLMRSGLAQAMLGATLLIVALNFATLNLGQLERVNAVPSIVVASFNLNLDNVNAPEFVSWVEAALPDMLALLEYTPQYDRLANQLRYLYPYQIGIAREDPFGLILLSMLPLRGEVLQLTPDASPLIDATSVVDRREIAIRVIHPKPPLTSDDKVNRDRQISDAVRGQTLPTIVAGDFNASPWALVMRDLDRAGFNRARGLFPTQSLYGGLPIDHILATKAHWQVVDWGVAGKFGSDHSPVWVNLILH